MSRAINPVLAGGLTAPEHSTDPEVVKRIFRARVLAALRDRGWTASELGRRAGVPRDQLSTYLREPPRSLPSPATILKIAGALGLGTADLMPSAGDLTVGAGTNPVELRQQADGSFRVQINVPLPFAAVSELMGLVQRHLPGGGQQREPRPGG